LFFHISCHLCWNLNERGNSNHPLHSNHSNHYSLFYENATSWLSISTHKLVVFILLLFIAILAKFNPFISLSFFFFCKLLSVSVRFLFDQNIQQNLLRCIPQKTTKMKLLRSLLWRLSNCCLLSRKKEEVSFPIWKREKVSFIQCCNVVLIICSLWLN